MARPMARPGTGTRTRTGVRRHIERDILGKENGRARDETGTQVVTEEMQVNGKGA
jgi:hypothetical protein